LDPPGWFRTRMPQHPQLPAVAAAVWAGQRLEIIYGDARRTIDPLGLVLKAGLWYLVARVGESERVYRVSRVRTIRETGERFHRPDDFDLPSYWDAWARRFEAERSGGYPVVLRV